MIPAVVVFSSSREVKANEVLLRKERETFEITVSEEKQKDAEEKFQQDLEEYTRDPKPRTFSSECFFL